MEKFTRSFFSMRMVAVGLLVFLLSIAAATFLESIHGIQTAKIMVYNALWFSILLLYLSLALIFNIYQYRMWQREKMAMLSFHVSFLVIMLGAALTRYVGFEGIMEVPEGKQVGFIYTADPYVLIAPIEYKEGPNGIKTKTYGATFTQKKYLSEIVHDPFTLNYKYKNNPLTITCIDFQANRKEGIKTDAGISTFGLEFFTNGRQQNVLFPNETIPLGSQSISFDSDHGLSEIQVKSEKGLLKLKTSVPLQGVNMSELKKEEQKAGIQDTTKIKQIPLNTWVTLNPRTLFTLGNQQFVFNRVLQHSKRDLIPTGNLKEGTDYLTVKVSYGKADKTVRLAGGMGKIPTFQVFTLGGQEFIMEYGAIQKKLPFAILCRNFQLDRYPGSDAPSSFASELSVLDGNKKIDRRIFMNHVLDYQGYRFFQSSFKLDDPKTPQNEEATVLQVNSDFWGTNVTYLGYLLMGIGMFLSLFYRKGRFMLLNQKLASLKEKRNSNIKPLATALFLLTAGLSIAQKNSHANLSLEQLNNHHQVVSEAHSEKVAELLVQEIKYVHEAHQFQPTGRMIPFHSLSDRLMRKIHRGISFRNYNAVQVILSMHLYQPYWYKQAIVQVPSAVRQALKLGEYASMEQLSDASGRFKWADDYAKAFQKRESQRSEFDKKLIKLNEKYEVINGIFYWDFLKITPIAGDKQNRWTQPKRGFELTLSTQALDSIYIIGYINKLTQTKDSLGIQNIIQQYDMYSQRFANGKVSFLDFKFFTSLRYATQTGSIAEAEGYLAAYKAILETIANVSPVNAQAIEKTLRYLLIEVNTAAASGNYSKADALLDEIITHQRTVGKAIVPSKNMTKLEIAYNEWEIFKRTGFGYFGLGFLMLCLFFVRLFARPEGKVFHRLSSLTKVFGWGILLLFVFHATGIALRWILSGHAPWSNGYEALVFIAWVTMLAGLLFSKKNAAVIPTTALLAYFMLFVTEQNLMDPEITPLVPVLQSYWLMVHVAIITGSYGFLGLGAILGLINLILFVLKRTKNKDIMELNIQEITAISEMTITIGLFMLTIGTFLGGVWANESWGRYWGWDPKETWALVSVLVYAILLHLRFIPKLNGAFLFNAYSFWGYSAILFTFFGVNFMLVGLHSYAQGEGLGTFPTWLIYTILVFYFITELAATRNRLFTEPSPFQWKPFWKTLFVKFIVVFGIFMSIYLWFKSYISVGMKPGFSGFVQSTFCTNLFLTLGAITVVNVVLLPLKMRLIFKRW